MNFEIKKEEKEEKEEKEKLKEEEEEEEINQQIQNEIKEIINENKQNENENNNLKNINEINEINEVNNKLESLELLKNELSPSKNNSNKRKSYKEVESRLYQSTAATNNGKWQGPSSPTPNKNHKNIQSSSITTPSDNNNQHNQHNNNSNHNNSTTNDNLSSEFETPNQNENKSSYFKDIPSRLHDTTAATKSSQWTKTTSSESTKNADLPKFSTSVRRASMGDIIIPQEKDKSTWKDPYKDTIQSRLFSPTIATTQGKWHKDDSPETPRSANGNNGNGNSNNTNGNGNSSSLESPSKSPTDKHQRRFSTSFLPTDLSITIQELPSAGKSSPYENVKPRLHMQTAAVKNAKWSQEKSSQPLTPEAPRFISTFSQKSTDFPSPPPPPVDNNTSEQFKDVKPRLYETTAAMTNAKYTPPDGSLDIFPKFDTTIRRTSIVASDFSTPPPVPETKKYKNVQSRLLTPTTASKEAAWKKENSLEGRNSLSPNPNDSSASSSPPPHSTSTPPARLLKPTVSSMHHVWPNAPNAPPSSPPEGGHPHLIKSKAYENVGSRLLCPTAAYLAKYTVIEDNGVPKEAFGHPIEPEYQKLTKKSTSSTSLSQQAPGSPGSNGHPPLSPSRSSSSDLH